MPPEPTDIAAEVSVVIRLLNPPEARTADELHAAIPDISPERIDAAIESLQQAGVLRTIPGQGLLASASLQRLEALGLICV